MNNEKNIKEEEILFHAEKLLHYNNLLITQCDSWLSAEEGNKNLMKKIRGREKIKKKTWFSGIFRTKVEW